MSSIKRIIKSNSRLFYGMKKTLLYVRYVMSLTRPAPYKELSNISVKGTYIIGENGYHCWFGYYDKSPMNSTNRYIAYTKVLTSSFPGEECEVCLYDTHTKTSKTVGKTTAWNWQQSCMPQWVSASLLRYNSYDDKSKSYVTRIVDVLTGKETTYARACYAMNKGRSAFLSLNFYRLHIYAKGYGYPFPVDSMELLKDGIWETHLDDNMPQLILSLQRVVDFNNHYGYEDYQHYINHVTYCPDENQIMFIHRWQKKGAEFASRLLIYNRKTDKIDTLLDNGHVSHYCWKSTNELMIYATNDRNEKGYMIINLLTKKATLIDGLPKEDGHPTYSKDGNKILTDTYPNAHRNQFLFIFNNTKELKILDKLYSPFKYFNDERCDLHPRWNEDCTQVMADNTSEGRRTIKVYRL